MTYQIRIPRHDAANRTNEMANGICRRSGGIKTNGMNAAYQMTIPMKSLVRMWELSAKKFFMCANP